jgi:hypothetical protein
MVELRGRRRCRMLRVEEGDLVLDRGKATRDPAPDDESESKKEDEPVAPLATASARSWVSA